MSLPTSLYQAHQVREMDRIAIKDLRIVGISLMEKAGQEVYEILQSNWPDVKTICVFCGSGNNAGDGYILARLAMEAHKKVKLLVLKEPTELRGDAKLAAELYMDAGGVWERFSSTTSVDADVVVDALIGSGLDRLVEGDFYSAIEVINKSGKPVLSMDVPSGLHTDTGQLMGVAVKAAITVSFVGLKQGLFIGQGPGHSGKVYFSDLGVPEAVSQQQRSCVGRIDFAAKQGLLQKRARGSHKGSFGHVLVVGGDYGYAGACRMCGEAAARTGAGLVSLATQPEHAVSIPLVVPELMSRGIVKVNDLDPLIEKATVVAVGPGLCQSSWSLELLSRVLDSKLPLVVDADALNLLAAEPSHSEQWVLTPHPGEAARLLDTSVKEIQAGRLCSARQLQSKYGGVIVLKGCGTVIADETEEISICSEGNPGMASGGMGDVLTGIIAGLIAQGFSLEDAARLGVCMHAAAADKVALEDGERGMLATDLMPWIRWLVNS